MDSGTKNMRNLVSPGTRRNWDKNLLQYAICESFDLAFDEERSEIGKPARLPLAEIR